MRFGKIEISKRYLAQLLCLNGNHTAKARKLLTDVPDDTKIMSVCYDSDRQVLTIILCGSAAPLLKVAEGESIPTIRLEFEEQE